MNPWIPILAGVGALLLMALVVAGLAVAGSIGGDGDTQRAAAELEPRDHAWLIPGPEAHWAKLAFEKYFLRSQALRRTSQALKLSLRPGSLQRHFASVPPPERVIQASRMSLPPKQMLVVKMSGVSTLL